MKRFLLIPAMVLTASGLATSFAAQPPQHDLAKRIYKSDNVHDAFSGPRWINLDAANALINAGKPDRFQNSLPNRAKQDPDGNYLPSIVQEKQDLTGEMDGPNGERWFYNAVISYESVYHNEYYTEYLPKSIVVDLFDSKMNLIHTLKDNLRLMPDESRVRLVDVLPKITQHYFNSDDNYEVALTLLNNPINYGIVSHTYVYSLGAPKNADGLDEPIKHISGVVNDILDASDENGENILMTFIDEGNSTGFTDEDLRDGEKYWQYQLGNWVRVQTFGAADADGNQTLLFDKQIIYYQSQGNQQDDPAAMPMILDGKPTICFPYYEKMFYKPFYSAMDDLQAEDDNNLVIEIWQQPSEGRQFELVQTTKIPVEPVDEPDIIWSYYGVGGFNFRNDVSWDNGQASFVITRRDYIASSDSERKTYLVYNPDGSMRKLLFENAQSIAFLADLPGFDPQTLFISFDGLDYIFNFMNMRTYEMDLVLNYGLQADPNDDPDFMMANIERTLTEDGKSFYYVAEMRMPEYDDIKDCTYMRVVWLTSDGKIDHFDRVNMGNKINYAKLYLSPGALKPDFFHSDANHEYMLLIKRAVDGSKTAEQLLIAQACSDENPEGKDLMMLQECEYGILNTITPFSSPEGNTLQVVYSNQDNYSAPSTYTICYYDLPLDVDRSESGIENVVAGNADGAFTISGSVVSAPGAEIEVFNLQGAVVARGFDSLSLRALDKGVYIVRANGASAKIFK